MKNDLMNSENVLKQKIDTLDEQLDLCKSVTGQLRLFIKMYLQSNGVFDLKDVDKEIKNSYKEQIDSRVDLNEKQKTYYKNLLDQVLLSYLATKNKDLVGCAESLIGERAVRNKVLLYLMENGIENCEDINYDIRSGYEMMLREGGCTKISEYVKAIDVLKLDAIRRNNSENQSAINTLSYYDKKVFLLYHPNYELAMTFYYVRNKEELLFDFSLDGSEIMKKQILSMLNHVLKEEMDWHDRRERFLVPLKMLYMFCVDNGVEDIELLTLQQIEMFRSSICDITETMTETYMQIIYNITKYLFMTNERINWDANIWYLEKFAFPKWKINSNYKTEKIVFNQIENNHNRTLLKKFIKHQMDLSQKITLQTIQGQYYDIVSFLLYCDGVKWEVVGFDDEKMGKYIEFVKSQNLQSETYSRRITSVIQLFDFI